MPTPEEHAVEAFVQSHLEFLFLDRYSSKPRWFMMVILSLVLERPIPENIRRTMNPDFERALRTSVANLFEYTRATLKENLRYAQFQKMIANALEAIQSRMQEAPDAQEL